MCRWVICVVMCCAVSFSCPNLSLLHRQIRGTLGISGEARSSPVPSVREGDRFVWYEARSIKEGGSIKLWLPWLPHKHMHWSPGTAMKLVRCSDPCEEKVRGAGIRRYGGLTGDRRAHRKRLTLLCLLWRWKQGEGGGVSIHASAHAAKVCDQGGISTVTPQSTFLDKSRFPIEMKVKRHLH